MYDLDLLNLKLKKGVLLRAYISLKYWYSKVTISDHADVFTEHMTAAYHYSMWKSNKTSLP